MHKYKYEILKSKSTHIYTVQIQFAAYTELEMEYMECNTP
jgi:hypothetical protein